MFPNPLVAELLTSIGGVAGGDAGGEGTVDVGGEGGQQDGGGCIRGSDGSGGGASFFSSSFAICDALSISNTASIAFLSAISALLHDDIVPDVPSVSILSAMAAMNPLPSAAISLGACTVMAVVSFAEVASSPPTDTGASFSSSSPASTAFSFAIFAAFDACSLFHLSTMDALSPSHLSRVMCRGIGGSAGAGARRRDGAVRGRG